MPCELGASILLKARDLFAATLPQDLYRKLVRRKFIWFALDDVDRNVDILYLYHSLEPISMGTQIRRQTLLINMNQTPEQLFDGIQKDAKYKIKRAEREGVSFVALASPSAEDIYELIMAHRDLEIRENRNPLTEAALNSFGENRQFVITKSLGTNDKPISWHGYVAFEQRVRLLLSITLLVDRTSSSEKNFAGRANRFHHWKDIVYFKEQGLKVFDFGGWVGPDGDPKQRSISEFKEGFGGQVADCYDAVIPVTKRGAFAVWLRKVLQR